MVGVLRGPGPRSLSPAGPRMRTQTTLPSARLSVETTLCRLRIPCTYTRSPCTAIEPYPAPSIAADHATGGPDRGHCESKPVSFEIPLRSGPRHCGQSNDGDCAFSAMTLTMRPTTASGTARLLMGLLTSKAHSGAYPKRARAAHLADEAGRRKLTVGESDRDVLCVKGVADPD